MTENTNNAQEPKELNAEELSEVTGGKRDLPAEFYDYLQLVANPDVKRYINIEINKGDIATAYRHLYQTLRLGGYTDQAMRIRQLYADTHNGEKIPGLL